MTPKCYYLFGKGWRLQIYDEPLGLCHEDTPFFFTQLSWGFPCNSVGKESACNVGDLGLIPGS